jgi:hypothetical protein
VGFHIKKNSAGEIDKYNVRLIARGFTQIHGVDYHEMFAPVAKLASVHTILAGTTGKSMSLISMVLT